MKSKMMVLLVCSVALIFFVLPAKETYSQAKYPSRGIEIICGWGVGGGSDTLTRKVAQLLSDYFKVPVHVTNAPGVAGLIGLAKVNAARADGYTIGYLTHSGLLRMMIDPSQKDFREYEPLAVMQLVYSQIYIRTDSPWKNFDDLLKTAKEKRITTAVTSPKGGDEFHIAYINLKRGTKFVAVPYRKPTERYAAMLGGHVDAEVEQFGDVKSMIDDGKIKAVVHFAEKRDPRFSNVPSSWEFNLPVSLPMSRGFLMKKGTPAPILQTLEKAFEHVYKTAELQEFNKKKRVDPDSWRNREQYKKLLEQQWQTATPIVKQLGWKAKK